MIHGIDNTLEILKRNEAVDEGVARASGLEGFTRTYGNVRDALLYAPLFVPQFLQIDGHVFLKDFGVKIEGGWAAVAEGIRQTEASSPAALKSYVDSFNWVELPYLLTLGLARTMKANVSQHGLWLLGGLACATSIRIEILS
jgi:hypothetical protein